jgi:phage terminase large subunit-like protein
MNVQKTIKKSNFSFCFDAADSNQSDKIHNFYTLIDEFWLFHHFVEKQREEG